MAGGVGREGIIQPHFRSAKQYWAGTMIFVPKFRSSEIYVKT